MGRFEYGSEIVCVDFHLHTRRDKEFDYSGDENRFVAEYIEALKTKGISVGIITNHNKFNFGEYKALSKKARQNELFLLPGVELSVKEGKNGLHTLIVFSPDDWLSNSNDAISGFINTAFQGVDNYENANTRCRFDLTQILEVLERYGKDYFMIFAHIEQSNGLLNECDGGLIQSLAQVEPFRKRILAVQKLRTRDNIPRLTQWLGYSIALVEGSDPKQIDEIGKAGCQTYIKIGDFSFDAIKYALVDHGSRIFHDYCQLNRGYIKAIHFIGGKFDGANLAFSPELNTLIGIRGSGKSSILEVLRWVLGLQASADRSYKDKLVEYILGSGGKVVVRVVDQHGREYDVSKINSDRTYIVDSNGNDLTVSISSLIKNPLYFGQKDLARSDTDTNYEKALLDKLLGEKVAFPEIGLQQSENQLIDAIKKLLDVAQIPEMIKELETKNSDLEYKLKIFNEKGITSKLEKQTEFNNDKSKLEGVIKVIDTVYEELVDFLKLATLEGIDISTYSSKYNSELFVRVQVVLNHIETLFHKLSSTRSDFEIDKNSLSGLLFELTRLIDSLHDEFAQIQRDINDDTLDLKGFLKYTQQKSTNEETISRLKREASSANEITKTILGIARRRNEILKSVFDSYQSEIDKLNKKQDALSISITFKGNSDALTRLLVQTFKGTNIRNAENKTAQICEVLKDGVSVLLDILIDNGCELRKILAEAEYAKLAEKISNDYTAFVQCYSDNRIDILYHNKPLRDHSLGQRASALVLAILTQDESDIIIIDQPEDDLDNQVVYKEFIKTVKEKKPSVQFIFATHNPNIPVLGDAERIIATEFNEKSISLAIGNIDKEQTHSLIIEIMEGGSDAFQRRNDIYMSWHKL